MTPGGVSTGTPGFFQLGKHSPVSLQLPVLRLGMLQDGDVGVGVFPEGEEVLILGSGLHRIAGEGVGTGEAETSEGTSRKVDDDAATVNHFLELDGSGGAVVGCQVGLAANIGRISAVRIANGIPILDGLSC